MKLRNLTNTWVLAVVVLLGLGANITSADSGSASFQYLVGSGLVCGLDPTACPDIASAANGDSIEISGQGTLSIHPKTVTGTGTFVHKDLTGAILATGIWTAEQLLSFDSYGTSPGLPPNFEGGLALILVHLSPDTGGPGFDAVLQVNCGVGKAPKGHSGDFAKLAVQQGVNFNTPVSGFTLYIRQP